MLITNDPWMGTGHLFDVTLMRPAFRKGKHVGFTMSVTHLPDIGGLGYGTVATQVFEEGLYIPITKIVTKGKLNEQLMEMIRANVRLPEEVFGDLMGHVTCNEVGERYLLEFMDEYAIEDLEPLSLAITSQTEKSMREQIAAIPDGVYKNRIQAEGYDEPLTLACSVNISGDGVHIDFTGTGPAIPRGINVPLCYAPGVLLFLDQGPDHSRHPQQRGRHQSHLDFGAAGMSLQPPATVAHRRQAHHRALRHAANLRRPGRSVAREDSGGLRDAVAGQRAGHPSGRPPRLDRVLRLRRLRCAPGTGRGAGHAGAGKHDRLCRRGHGAGHLHQHPSQGPFAQFRRSRGVSRRRRPGDRAA